MIMRPYFLLFSLGDLQLKFIRSICM
ncbi:unnamed protein product [Spirodela intermedia]|uniref:Uncharacterized protein n=1 Tax=Spirodela intermedia TaxID=51605 RepID=A0A7I8KLI5_SPIIN|nr:unnamed protein product [Spirodela intermedia]